MTSAASGAEDGAAAAKLTLKSMGRQISPAVLQDVRSLYSPLLRKADPEVRVSRDVAYGTHPRQRLNVFSPRPGTSTGDVLTFVHGGGFVTGDKEEVPQAFHDNVGNWAASHGIIGVVINYRLAPEHPWPAGAEDVAAAVAWTRDTICNLDGNAERIFLMGHSAGAAHVAGYLANDQFWKWATPGVAGAICVSGIYDLRLRPVNSAYFGEDDGLYDGRSPLAGIAKSPIPLLVTTAENDPEFIQRHTISLLAKCLEERQSLPRLSQIHDHNHFSTLLHLNTPDESLSGDLLSFISGAR